MALGLLAGAIGGAGMAVQENARSRIDELKQVRLREIDQRYQTSERVAGQEFQRGERVEGQEFTAGENQAGREHDRSLTEMRESGADRRTGMQVGAANQRANAGAWQLVPTEGGGMARYNTITGQMEDAPPGLLSTAMTDGRISDRDRYRLDSISGQMDAIRKRVGDEMRDMTPEERMELGSLQSQYDALLGDAGGTTTLQQLLAGEGAIDGDGFSTGGPDDSIRGKVQQEQKRRQDTQEANEARRQYDAARDGADELLRKIEREKSGGSTRSGLVGNTYQARGMGGISDSTMAEAQQLVNEMMALEESNDLSDAQKRWLAQRIQRLQDAGIPISLEQ